LRRYSLVAPRGHIHQIATCSTTTVLGISRDFLFVAQHSALPLRSSRFLPLVQSSARNGLSCSETFLKKVGRKSARLAFGRLLDNYPRQQRFNYFSSVDSLYKPVAPAAKPNPFWNTHLVSQTSAARPLLDRSQSRMSGLTGIYMRPNGTAAMCVDQLSGPLGRIAIRRLMVSRE
jgi:hypothetical protein